MLHIAQLTAIAIASTAMMASKNHNLELLRELQDVNFEGIKEALKKRANIVDEFGRYIASYRAGHKCKNKPGLPEHYRHDYLYGLTGATAKLYITTITALPHWAQCI